MVELKTKIGKLYYEGDEVYDSEKRFIGVYSYTEDINKLKEIRDITDLQNFGLVDNLVYAQSEDDVIEQYRIWYINEGILNYYDAEDIYENLHINNDKILRDFTRKVGRTYFIPNFF